MKCLALVWVYMYLCAEHINLPLTSSDKVKVIEVMEVNHADDDNASPTETKNVASDVSE